MVDPFPSPTLCDVMLASKGIIPRRHDMRDICRFVLELYPTIVNGAVINRRTLLNKTLLLVNTLTTIANGDSAKYSCEI